MNVVHKLSFGSRETPGIADAQEERQQCVRVRVAVDRQSTRGHAGPVAVSHPTTIEYVLMPGGDDLLGYYQSVKPT